MRRALTGVGQGKFVPSLVAGMTNRTLALVSSTGGVKVTSPLTASNGYSVHTAYSPSLGSGLGRIVAIISGTAYYSDDLGDTWSSGVSATGSIQSLYYSQVLGAFVMVGLSGTLRSSSNGTSWANQSTPYGNVAFAGAGDISSSRIAVVGNAAVSIRTSSSSWGVTLGLPSVWFRDATYSSSNRAIIVGNNGAIYRSTNYTSWNSQSAGVGSSNLFGVAYSPLLDIFVAVGAGGAVTWADGGGGSWTPTDAGGSVSFSGVKWSDKDSCFYANASTPTQIYKSSDGQNWATFGPELTSDPVSLATLPNFPGL